MLVSLYSLIFAIFTLLAFQLRQPTTICANLVFLVSFFEVIYTYYYSPNSSLVETNVHDEFEVQEMV